MSLAVLRSRALAGLSAPEVIVEVHLAAGLPSFTLIGLPDTEVKEARDRVRAATQNCGFEFPQHGITVNRAPADLPKESGRFDLPIAPGILDAAGQVRAPKVDSHEFAGEPALSGDLRAVRGKLSGPLLDRIDLMLDVSAVAESELSARGDGESSATVCARVSAARALQIERQGKPNALLSPDEIDRHARPDEAGAQLLKQAMACLSLTARAYHRILKVARSNADLAGAAQINAAHVAEAIHYRRGLAD